MFQHSDETEQENKWGDEYPVSEITKYHRNRYADVKQLNFTLPG